MDQRTDSDRSPHGEQHKSDRDLARRNLRTALLLVLLVLASLLAFMNKIGAFE